MLISVYTNEVYDGYGRINSVYPQAVVNHSPREGLDHEVIRNLENELQELVTKRLNEAISKKDEQ